MRVFTWSIYRLKAVCGVVALGLAALAFSQSPSQAADEVDTALIVSVDVSNSVDAERYKLQMEGIAQALEDPQVIDAIISGPKAGILFSMACLWLIIHKKRLGDAITAHAITNFLLAVWVVWKGDWKFF